MSPSLKFVVVGGLGILAAAPAQAQQLGACPPRGMEIPAPVVKFDFIEPKPVYHHDRDLPSLAQVANHLEKLPQGGAFLTGLTTRQEDFKLTVRSKVVGRGPYCVWPTEVTVSMGHPTTDVYVAANYPEGSCEYGVVWRHENTHVALTLGALRQWAPRLEATVKRVSFYGFPTRTSDPHLNVQDIIMARLRPDFDAMELDIRARNATIDTPEAYREQNAVCHNWAPRGTRLPSGKIVN